MTYDEIRAIEVRQKQYAEVFDHSFNPAALSNEGRLCLVDVPRLIGEIRNLQADRNQLETISGH